jgi:hypothetical protein
VLLWGSICHHVKARGQPLHPIYALIERMSLLDVAPTVARVLGLEMKGVDGTAVPGLGR